MLVASPRNHSNILASPLAAPTYEHPSVSHCRTRNQRCLQKEEVRALSASSLRRIRFGAPRIHGELHNLGISASQSTVA
jgi:hypothetical protein